MTVEIPLTRGLVALVDDEDAEWLSQWKWHAVKTKSGFYAARAVRTSGKKKVIYMHRVICDPPIGMLADHANNDTLDNRRRNLRPSSHRQNNQNRRVSASSAIGLKGVRKNGRRFMAKIGSEGRVYHLGIYDTAEQANAAYLAAAKKLFGEFARAA